MPLRVDAQVDDAGLSGEVLPLDPSQEPLQLLNASIHPSLLVLSAELSKVPSPTIFQPAPALSPPRPPSTLEMSSFPPLENFGCGTLYGEELAGHDCQIACVCISRCGCKPIGAGENEAGTGPSFLI